MPGQANIWRQGLASSLKAHGVLDMGYVGIHFIDSLIEPR